MILPASHPIEDYNGFTMLFLRNIIEALQPFVTKRIVTMYSNWLNNLTTNAVLSNFKPALVQKSVGGFKIINVMSKHIPAT